MSAEVRPLVEPIRRVRDRRALATVFYVVLVAWGALAFGAVYSWGYIPLLAGCVTLGLLGLLPLSVRKMVAVGPAAAGLGAVVGGVLIQLIPLSRATLARLSPAADALLRQSNLLYTLADPLHPISISPSETALGLAFLAALSVLLLGALQTFGETSWRPFVRGVLVVGVLLALVGIIQKATSAGRAYGFWVWPINVSPFGPFGNRNHFAGWIVMVLPVGLAYLLGLIERRTHERNDQDWRRRVLWLGSSDASEILLVGAAVIVMALALVLTLSRSGIGAFLFALVITAWCLTRAPSARTHRILGVSCLACLAVVSVGWTGTDSVIARFVALGGSGLDGRVGLWRDTIRIVRDFPITGIGLNTYGHAMLFYQTVDLPFLYVWAHNDYLQLAAEGGLLLGLPAVVLAGLFVREVRSRFRERADDCVAHWLRIGAVTGISAVALQDVVDFSLQIPANAVLFTLLCALAAARGRNRSDVPRGLA